MEEKINYRKVLEDIRWPNNSTICVHCKSEGVKKLGGKAKEKGLWKCNSCRKNFTVTVGTIFEGGHLDIEKIFRSVFLILMSKEYLTIEELSSKLNISYGTGQRIVSIIENKGQIFSKKHSQKKLIEQSMFWGCALCFEEFEPFIDNTWEELYHLLKEYFTDKDMKRYWVKKFIDNYNVNSILHEPVENRILNA